MLLDALVIFPFVGTEAIGAVLIAVFGIGEFTATLVAQGVQRTVAEETAEGLRICTGMARKILALLVLEKIIICHISFSFFLWYNGREVIM